MGKKKDKKTVAIELEIATDIGDRMTEAIGKVNIYGIAATIGRKMTAAINSVDISGLTAGIGEKLAEAAEGLEIDDLADDIADKITEAIEDGEMDGVAEGIAKKLSEATKELETDGIAADIGKKIAAGIENVDIAVVAEAIGSKISEMIKAGVAFAIQYLLGGSDGGQDDTNPEKEDSESGIAAIEKMGQALAAITQKTLAFSKGIMKLVPGIALFKQIGSLGVAAVKKLAAGIGDLVSKGMDAFVDHLKSSIQTNEAFSNSLNHITSNLKVAFMPIYNVILPAVNALMSLLATAAAYVANFMSLLFGTTFDASAESAKALDAAANAADGYGSSVEAAAKAVGQLGIDELNILEDSSGSSSGGGGSSLDFDTGDIEVALGGIEDIMNRILASAKQAWNDYGSYVIAAWGLAMSHVKAALIDVGKTFLSVWENGAGYETIKNILILLADIGLLVSDIAVAWREAWDREGEGVIQTLFDMINGVLALVHAISDSFRNAWNDGTGVEILSHILGIMADIQGTVANLTIQFREAWDTAGVGDAIASGILRILSSILGTIRDITAATKEWAGNLDFTPLLVSIENLLAALAPFTDTIGNGLKGFYEQVLLPLSGWVIEDVLPAFLNILAGAIEFLNVIISDAMAVLSWLWEHFLEPVAGWTGGVIVAVLEGIGAALSWIAQNEVVVAVLEGLAIAIGLVSAALAIKSAALAAYAAAGGVATTVTAAFSAAMAALTSPIGIIIIVIAALVAGIILLIKNWETVKEVVINVWQQVLEAFQAALEWLRETFKNAWDTLCSFLIEKITAFMEMVGEIWSTITAIFQQAMEWIQEVFQTDWSESLGVLGELLNGFFVTVEQIWNGIQTIFEGIIGFVKGVFTGDWKAAWEGVKTIFKGVFDTFVGIAKGPINGIIALMNGMIEAVNSVVNKINSINVDLPFGMGSIGFNLPTLSKIPYLAQGGYVGPNQPQLAMIGDNRHEGEIVSPESKLEAMAVRAAQMVIGNQGGGDSDQLMTVIDLMQRMMSLLENLETVVNIDTRELHRKLKDVNKRVGYSFN